MTRVAQQDYRFCRHHSAGNHRRGGQSRPLVWKACFALKSACWFVGTIERCIFYTDCPTRRSRGSPSAHRRWYQDLITGLFDCQFSSPKKAVPRWRDECKFCIARCNWFPPLRPFWPASSVSLSPVHPPSNDGSGGDSGRVGGVKRSWLKCPANLALKGIEVSMIIHMVPNSRRSHTK